MSEDVTTMQLPINVEALLAKQRADIAGRISAPSGDYIKVGQDKTFTFPNDDTTGGPIEAIILDFQFHNVYYANAYQRGSYNRALCYANDSNGARMAPADDSPEKQADTCAVCPQNQWGSRGDAKACKNSLLIALLPPDATLDTPIHILSASPTAMKHFQKYMRVLTTTVKRGPAEIVTKIGFNPDVTYPQLVFEPSSTIENGRRVFQENPILGLSLSRLEEARERLEADKPDTTDRPEPAAPSRTIKRK